MALSQIDKQYPNSMLIIMALLIGLLLPLNAVRATPIKRPARIGWLTASWGPTPQVVGMQDGLAELGYAENQDYFLGVRFTQGNNTALAAAARDLVKLGVDIIISETHPSIKAAQLATTQIPIVFASATDPIGQGFINSFARPGGNITGVAELALDLGPKRLQLFQELIPRLRRVLFPYDVADPMALREVETYRTASRQLGIELIEKPLRTPQEAKTFLNQLQLGDTDGVLSPRCCSMNIPGFILDTITPKQIPAMFDAPFWVERGAFASYGQAFYTSGKQSARIVDKIIKGQKPSDIPVEVNSQIEFVINLPVAKRMELTIAPEVLYRADRIIR